MLGIAWLGWRGPHLVDDVRYSLATPWPGVELTLADDSTVEISGRRITVSGGMGVDCMPGIVPVPIPTPPCRGPGLAVRLHARGMIGLPELPLPAHARVESEGVVWETARREAPRWEGGRVIRMTVWLEHDGRLYRLMLPATPIERVE